MDTSIFYRKGLRGNGYVRKRYNRALTAGKSLSAKTLRHAKSPRESRLPSLQFHTGGIPFASRSMSVSRIGGLGVEIKRELPAEYPFMEL